MSSVLLLDKTRKIGNLLHNNKSVKVVFNDFCSVLSEVLNSDIYVVSQKGKVLGLTQSSEKTFANELISPKRGTFIDKSLNSRFLGVLSTKENCSLLTLGFEKSDVSSIKAIISPIIIAGHRYGTLFVCRKGKEYDIDDIILCEYGATVVGLEIMRAVSEENVADETKLGAVKNGLEALTASELKAAKYMLEALDDGEGIIVTSRIADEVGITRSVLVNSLKKLESAGIIDSHSAGMKGTFVKVLNDSVFEMLNSI